MLPLAAALILAAAGPDAAEGPAREVLFSDDFSSGLGGWTVLSGRAEVIPAEGGRAVRLVRGTLLAAKGVDLPGRFVLSARAILPADAPGPEAPLLFRAAPDGSSFVQAFLDGPTGTARLAVLAGGRFSAPEIARLPSPPRRGKWIRMEVVVDRREVYLSVDGRPVLHGRIPEGFRGGTVGLRAGNSDVIFGSIAAERDGAISFLYTKDGRNQGGGPSGWGAAAIVAAVVEGLAGVEDRSTLFRDLALSPRWAATTDDDVPVTVRYGPSGAFVGYRLRHDRGAREIRIDLSSTAERVRWRVLVPAGSRPAAVRVDGQEAAFTVDRIGSGAYAAFGPTGGEARAAVRYATDEMDGKEDRRER
jgi:hypothetical protein